MKEVVLIDLFSGIGGMHKGIEDAGFVIKKCYFSEIDKHATATYKYRFPNAEHIGSVNSVSGRDIRANHQNDTILITFGWPCQDNSIAGKRKGQRRDTRSGLLFEAGRIINESRCELFIAENVKGLSSVNQGYDFYETIEFLTYLDTDSPQYTVEVQLFNTDWFLPQNRERYYFVGHIGTECIRRIFPFQKEGGVFKISQQTQGDRNVMPTLIAGYHKQPRDGAYIKIKSATKNGYELAEVGDSINFSVPDSETRRGRVGKKKAQTLDTACNQGVFTNDGLRRYTENEAEKLQGFDVDWTKYGNYDGKIKLISRTQRYRQIGNAVSVCIPRAIGEKILQFSK